MIVIPAEAGIQKIRNWIPIFMGMTKINARDIRGKNIRLNSAFYILHSATSAVSAKWPLAFGDVAFFISSWPP
jgi:hypothetical protein